MMPKGNRILLVEGDSDQKFFYEVLKHLNLSANVTVAPPKSIGGRFNNKQGAFNHLPILLDQLSDGQITNLALIVDADCVSNGGGFQRAIDVVTEIVEPYQYTISSRYGGGITFRNKDGLPDFGLWVMPDNLNDGGLENWIAGCINSNSKSLLSHAQLTVASLPQPQRFKPTHLSKAEIATWLAWEKSPGHGFQRLLDDNLIDPASKSFKDLCAWLCHIYK